MLPHYPKRGKHVRLCILALALLAPQKGLTFPDGKSNCFVSLVAVNRRFLARTGGSVRRSLPGRAVRLTICLFVRLAQLPRSPQSKSDT